MSVGGQGSSEPSKGREDRQRQPRRRWRTLQNRIERARQLRQADTASLLKPRRPGGGGTTVS